MQEKKGSTVTQACLPINIFIIHADRTGARPESRKNKKHETRDQKSNYSSEAVSTMMVIVQVR